MNLSLKNRVAISFGIATLSVLASMTLAFNFLNNLNNEIEAMAVQTNKVSLLTDEIRISAVSILKYQRRLALTSTKELRDKVTTLCESFTSQLQTLDSLYQDADVKRVVARMLSYVDSLQLVLGKGILNRNKQGQATIGELADKILDAFSEFQDIQYFQTVEKDKKIKDIIIETKKHMMITLIIGFLATILLGLVVPGKIALPFKKIRDGIRELQECNFDISIYYNQDDELGEIAREMNKMIQGLKVFEELRTDRISVENRKFDALANLVKRPVLVANAEGKLMYMNNRLYSILQVQSEDVIGKDMSDSLIPSTIAESCALAIKRRSKIENAEILIHARKIEIDTIEDLETQAVASATDEGDDIIDLDGEIDKESNGPEIIYQGHANVIPIRGKDSSLDYYLMVLSTEVFS